MSYEEEKQDRKIEQLEIKIEWLQDANTNFVHRICDQAQEIERQATRIQELKDDLETAKASIRFDREEIERMRPYEKVAADLQACGSYVGIGPGEGDLPITERVRRCVNRLKETQHEYEQKLITKDARIQELEDALAEYQRLGKIISESVIPCLTVHGNCDQCRPKPKAACEAIAAIRKGKIEPNATKPRSWQITDERKAALKRLYGLLVIRYKYGYPDETETLRSMLQEAGQ